MKEKLEALRAEARAQLENCNTAAELDALRVRYLGKKGELTALLRGHGCPCSRGASQDGRFGQRSQR